MIHIHLPEVDSTNSYLQRQLDGGADFPEGTTFYTARQNRGRGQLNNSWESEPDQNLAFSLLLKPDFLPISTSFALSEVTALAIAETLDEWVPGFCIKWPNDIYHDNRKVAGVLIENRLTGRCISHSIIGVGINLNQRVFRSDAPNPVSVAQLRDEAHLPDQHIDIECVLQSVIKRLTEYYRALRSDPTNSTYQDLHARYLNKLYRRADLHPYQDAATGEYFDARIVDVEPCGAIRLEQADGTLRRYMFKEVKFCLPCGVTKE